MSELQPKQFQNDALNTLREYLEMSRLLMDPAKAFVKVTDGHSYRPLTGMETVPSVCLRLPTGGGKTMLAAMSVQVAAESYLDRELPLVLWLVPTDAILQQTRRALSDTDHPYRRALGKGFGDRVRVFALEDFAIMTPQDIRSNVCVVIGTMAMVQQTNTDKYRVYRHNENLEGHFNSAKARATPGLEMIEAGVSGAGTPKFSFANLMKVQQPLLILDEAHRFMTPLANEVRQRLGAGVIVEFTATPQPESNELYYATAAEVKDAEMIKLPVVLAEHTGVWEQAVHEAITTRKTLAEIAVKEPEYVRPLLLIQAQNAGSEGDWKAVKQYLLETEGLSENEVAVHTGDVRELKDIDLFARSCPITTIITVKALKEGWDCSFAYVLCSTANVGSATDVEQLLGRVLRMPYAKARVAPELNKAYAHVSSERFQEAASSLKDCLIGMGFEEQEAKAAIQSSLGDEPLFDLPPAFEMTLMEAPELEGLTTVETSRVALRETLAGQVEMQVQGPISDGLLAVVLERVPEALQPKVIERVKVHNAEWAPSPAQRGVRFAVPRLAVWDEEQLILFTKNYVQEVADFNLLKYPANLDGFDYDASTRRYVLDVVGEHVKLDLMGQEESQLAFAETSVTKIQLVAWLDSKLRHPKLNKATLSAWILGAIDALLGRPHISLRVLDRGRFILFRKLEEARDRAQEAEESLAYQKILYGPDSEVSATDEFAFNFPQTEYPAASYCDGTKFQRHYYRRVGEMKNYGEEYSCAVEIDQNKNVKHWVRNLAGRGRETTSFWLQTKTDRFYPDFVAEMEDGTILVVEYKGDGYRTNDDSKEKDELGKLWALRSGGRAKFLMAVSVDTQGRDVRQQIKDIIGV